MGLSRFARLGAYVAPFAVVLGIAAPAAALPKLQLHPVELIGYAGPALRLSVELPCGGEFYGLVTRVAQKGTLEVAAAVAQESIVCTSMPRPTEIVVDYLATTGFAVIAPMLVDGPQNRLMIARIQELSIVPKTAVLRSKLTAVYEPRCGLTVGTLIRQAAPGRLEIAFVERARSGPMASCTAKPKTRTITAIDIKPKLKIAALRDKQTSLGRAYELRLADVKPGTVRLDKRGALTVGYRRACNEAPVGIVLGEPGALKAGRTVAVSVLVARYFNYQCGETQGGKVFDAEIVEPYLTLPKDMRVSLLTATTAELTLDTPLKMTRRLGELELTHAQPCAESFAVYGRDGRGALAVGVLSRPLAGKANASSCKRASGKVSLTQPFIASTLTPSELAAMRLKGSLAH